MSILIPNLLTSSACGYVALSYRRSSAIALFRDRLVLTVVIQDYFEKKKGYLRAQVGNPDGEDQPNKKVQIFRGGV